MPLLGEHTRPACGCRRLDHDFKTPTFLSLFGAERMWLEVFGNTTRRRRVLPISALIRSSQRPSPAAGFHYGNADRCGWESDQSITRKFRPIGREFSSLKTPPGPGVRRPSDAFARLKSGRRLPHSRTLSRSQCRFPTHSPTHAPTPLSKPPNIRKHLLRHCSFRNLRYRPGHEDFKVLVDFDRKFSAGHVNRD